MAPNSGKVSVNVKNILKLDVTIPALAACCIQELQHTEPLQRPLILKWLKKNARQNIINFSPIMFKREQIIAIILGPYLSLEFVIHTRCFKICNINDFKILTGGNPKT